MILQPLSGWLRASVRFFPHPVPAMLSVRLTTHVPLLRSISGLPRFTDVPCMG